MNQFIYYRWSTLLSLVALLFFAVNAFAECSPQDDQDNFGNQVHDYASPQNPPDELIVIMPPTGGENVADQNLAAGLCRRGLNASIFNYLQTPDKTLDLSVHDANSIKVLTWLNDFLSHRKEARVVLVGSSLGSLYSSMATSLGLKTNSKIQDLVSEKAFPAKAQVLSTWTSFKKIKGAVLTVCGGSLAEILANSELPPVKLQRESRESKFKSITDEEYEVLLKGAIYFDPSRFASPELKNKVYMFMSNSDVIVPAKTQFELWSAYGQPSRSVFGTDHMWTIAWVYFFRQDSISRFAKSVL